VNPVHFSSQASEWGTPQRLFDELHAEFHFTRDVCASAENCKVKNFWSKADDALAQKWEGTLWMNPPYGRAIAMFIRKAYESRATATIVALIPVRTDSRWWHQWVMEASEIRFIKGRLRFQGAKDGAPFPSCIVIFRQQKRKTKHDAHD
jgi:phage N-6-adenine-methyltransferase